MDSAGELCDSDLGRGFQQGVPVFQTRFSGFSDFIPRIGLRDFRTQNKSMGSHSFYLYVRFNKCVFYCKPLCSYKLVAER